MGESPKSASTPSIFISIVTGLSNGLPVVAPNLGAFAERLKGRNWTWICDWQKTDTQWLSFFDQIRMQHFCSNTPPGPLPDCYANVSKGQIGAMNVDVKTHLEYSTEYLQSLTSTKKFSVCETLALSQDISQLYPDDTTPAPLILILKTRTLAGLRRLRGIPVLSRLTQLIPIHLQRKIKTWLRR